MIQFFNNIKSNSKINIRLIIYVFLYGFVLISEKNRLVHGVALVGQNIRRLTQNEFPYTVAIVQRNDRYTTRIRLICIGTLISRKDILSSEHCLEGEMVPNTEIIAGSINITQGRRYTLYWWITYDQWASQMDVKIEFSQNDIAILRLTEDRPNEINPAPIMYVQDNRDLTGMEATIATWTSTDQGQISSIMEAVDVTIITNRECVARCSRLCGRTMKIPKRIICSAAEPYALLTGGDSGGPLLMQSNIIAVNIGLCPPSSETQLHREKVNVHLGIKYYSDFVTDVMYNF